MKIAAEFPTVTGVFHCYSGSLEMARWLIERGWYIGFGGVLTFKNARKALEVAANIPLERIVLETDCPYLAPEPVRGRRNEPANVYYVAEKIAALRGMPLEEFSVQSTRNALAAYRIG